MDLSKISCLFQQNNQNMRNKKSELQNPLNDVLNKLADQAIDAQSENLEPDFQFKLNGIKKDTYTTTLESEALEEAAPESLKLYVAVLKLFSGFSSSQEKDLIDFKEQLMSFDQEIEKYQGIIKGDADLPEGTTMEDVMNLLTATQQTREKYIKENSDKLNGLDLYNGEFLNRIVHKVCGENKFSDMDESNRNIDSSSSNIYAEIDRILESTRGISRTLNEGIKRIYDILEKKGYGEEKYKYYQTALRENRSLTPDEKSTNTFQLLLAWLKENGGQNQQTINYV